MTKFGIIYLVTNKVNGKQYVGKTVETLARRKAQHCCRGYVLYRAIKKHGKAAFDWKVLCKCPIEQLDDMEKKFIRQYKCCVTLGGRGYNIQEGGNGAPYGDANPSKRPEVREAQRQANLGDLNPMKNPLVSDKVRKALTGRSKTLNHRKNISEGMMGHFTPSGEANWISKVYRITLPNGETFTIKGLLNFCKQANISHDLLRYALRKFPVSHKGYKCERLTNHNS